MVGRGEYVVLSWEGVFVAALMGAAALVYTLIERLRLGREAGVGMVRAFVQLLAAGYAVGWLMRRQVAYANLLAVCIMLLVAILVVLGRLREQRFYGKTRAVVLGLVLGALPVLLVAIVGVVRPKPLFDARYLIPIGSMVISAAMNNMTQVLNRLHAEFVSNRGEVEARLLLGATAAQAAHPHIRASVRAGMLRVLNVLHSVGLVHIPGMMTGQITGGVRAVHAAQYQIVIMYLLMSASCFAGIIAAKSAAAAILSNERVNL